ncbi:aldo/keto reductase [Actibacterium lipolyticum]|uniref:General stress protein 69 n=1 Tax=Actibacterium lipolyticum TaxID=1524263 RepID=A0A238JYU2_9RHOB|nr:aldo/keto reductase [Actibacterium lipolyticum]SMX35294.1 General stress protein 69 [Actibacterium lipolyticum]
MIAAPQDLACEKATVAGPLRIGIGCMALTGLYGSISASDARNVLDVAADLGFRLFDTAPLYANGNNEELIGEVFGSRASISVSTKFGLSENNDNKLVRDSRPSSIRASVEASLGRLRRERIDLLIQHRPDPGVDDQEVAGAVQNLIDEGKVASFGLSGTLINRIKPMAAQCTIAAVQNELSILSDPDFWSAPNEVGEMGSFFMAYAPIARGLLSWPTARAAPTADDFRAQIKAFENPERSVPKKLHGCIQEIASSYGVSATAVTLSWVRSRGSNVVPIPGPRNTNHLADLLDAANLEIQASDISMIDEIAKSCFVR